MENKKSEMSVEYNMDEMKKSLKNLKETECYDVEKYTYSLLHQTRQLEYFYCQLVEEENPEPDQTYIMFLVDLWFTKWPILILVEDSLKN